LTGSFTYLLYKTASRYFLRKVVVVSLAVRRIPTGTGGALAIGFTAVSVHGYVQSFLRRMAEELPHLDAPAN
jgi:hypothetical protein